MTRRTRRRRTRRRRTRQEEAEEEEEEQEEEEQEEQEEQEEEATDIKSNNPHLAGGEKSTLWFDGKSLLKSPCFNGFSSQPV